MPQLPSGQPSCSASSCWVAAAGSSSPPVTSSAQVHAVVGITTARPYSCSPVKRRQHMSDRPCPGSLISPMQIACPLLNDLCLAGWEHRCSS